MTAECTNTSIEGLTLACPINFMVNKGKRLSCFSHKVTF